MGFVPSSRTGDSIRSVGFHHASYGACLTVTYHLVGTIEQRDTNVTRKILIMGLPGAGKTALAQKLVPLTNAVLFNADDVRANISQDLGFSHEDRVEHARRMGWLCDRVVEADGAAIADFICPTPQTRAAFGQAFIVWVDRIKEGRFADTNRMFIPPGNWQVRVAPEGRPRYWAEQILEQLRPMFDLQRSTALFAGRYQPFHDGTAALSRKASGALVRLAPRCAAHTSTGRAAPRGQTRRRHDYP